MLLVGGTCKYDNWGGGDGRDVGDVGCVCTVACGRAMNYFIGGFRSIIPRHLKATTEKFTGSHPFYI